MNAIAQPPETTPRHSRIPELLRRATIVAGAAIAILTLAGPALGLSESGFAADRLTALALGLGIVAAAAFYRGLSPGPSLALCTLAYMAIPTALIILSPRIELGWTFWQLRRSLGRRTPEGLWAPHPRYAYAPRSDSTFRHRHYDFDATYTIDESGARATPDPVRGLGDIMIVGGSYTFGWGVQDVECYPALLGSRYWTDFKILNVSAAGWGTTQAYLALQDALLGETPPEMVLYGWIGHHVYRNYSRSVWLRRLAEEAEGKIGIPHFEIEDEKLVFKGIAGAEAGLEDSEFLAAKERALTFKLIEEMIRLTRSRGIPFYILLLPCHDDFITDTVLDEFDAAGFPYIDLREAGGDYFPHDRHPTADWHRSVAEAIAESPRIRTSIETIRRSGGAE